MFSGMYTTGMVPKLLPFSSNTCSSKCSLSKSPTVSYCGLAITTNPGLASFQLRYIATVCVSIHRLRRIGFPRCTAQINACHKSVAYPCGKIRWTWASFASLEQSARAGKTSRIPILTQIQIYFKHSTRLQDLPLN